MDKKVTQEKHYNIWYLHHTATSPDKSGLTRPYFFAKNLIERGHSCIVFSSAFLHYTHENLILDNSKYMESKYGEVPFVYIKTTPYNKSKIRRVMGFISYYHNMIKESKVFNKAYGYPNVIIGSSAHPLAAVAAIKLSKRFKCISIVEIRDLWPESFVAYGLISKKNPLLYLLYMGEKWIYKNADRIVFTVEGGADYIREKGWNHESGGPIKLSKVYHINNGVELEDFNQGRETYIFKDDDLKNPDIFKVVYTGSIRLVNRVDVLIDVARLLSNTNIKFLLWGDGNYLDQLREKVRNEDLKNIVFKGRVDKKYIPGILVRADLNIILGETVDLYRYGISPNKLFEYFAAGKPVLQTFKTNYSIVERSGAGVELLENNPRSIADGVLFFSRLNEAAYNSICEKSISVSKAYDFISLTNKLLMVIEGKKQIGEISNRNK